MPVPARRALIAVAAAAISAGCNRGISFAPPPQKKMPEGSDPKLAVMLLNAQDSFRNRAVADMLTADRGSNWVWTNQNPRFRIFVERDVWECVARFTVAKVVIDKVGPVTVSLVVNGRALATRTYAKDGEYELRAEVPQDVLKANAPDVFGLDINPVYIAETDGVKLGVLLEEIGFERAGKR
jgi:hypothetical protein